MADIEIELKGGDELLRKLQLMGLDVSQSLEVVSHAGAQVLVQAASQLEPGADIRAETSEKKAKRVTVDIGPSKEKWYHGLKETGVQPHEITGAPLAFPDDGELVVTGRVSHPGMPAQPFLRPSFDSEHKNAAKEVGRRIKRIVGR